MPFRTSTLTSKKAQVTISRPRQESDHRSLRSNRPHNARDVVTRANGEAPKVFGVGSSLNVSHIGACVCYRYSDSFSYPDLGSEGQEQE